MRRGRLLPTAILTPSIFLHYEILDSCYTDIEIFSTRSNHPPNPTVMAVTSANRRIVPDPVFRAVRELSLRDRFWHVLRARLSGLARSADA